ncbi:MAG: pyruvate, phosphate dikinase, partial [Oscillospiraceae bacterium]|nr:pyruvate, phosphate dikinase [Oscillospiraceae bacterium]
TCCVAGCGDIEMHEEEKYFTLGGKKIVEGDYVSLDGSTGNVYKGELPTVEAEITGDFEKFMGWADKYRTLKIRTNADTPVDAAKAIEFGAEGIGLCRTEHMFFEPDRIPAIREMIVAKTLEQRKVALDKLLPMQKGDFEGIFAAMGERPVTIRLLDPPLHEFLPTKAEDIAALAKELKMSVGELEAVIESLHELNPMMGHRGCRLAVSYPEIAEMQTRAIIEAAINVKKLTGVEIMIPLVCDLTELKFVKKIIVETADKIIKKAGVNLVYNVGTMIEIPRAALLADEIATEAEFFSFGTNDLTQMTYGLSRDDAGRILDDYFEAKIFEADPTARLDRSGVGKLIKMAVELGKKTRPGIKLGICGEHGGDPSSIEFCHDAGLAYVSCSPFRVPIARLAAAQAAIANPGAK